MVNNCFLICLCILLPTICTWHISKTSLTGSHKCFANGHLTPEICCNSNTKDHAAAEAGTYGSRDAHCWRPPFLHLYRDVCCDPTGRDQLLHQLEGELLVGTASLDSSMWNVGALAEDVWKHLEDVWVHTAFAQAIENSLWPNRQLANESNLVPERMEPGIVILAMLKALRPGAAWALARRAYLNFQRARFTLWDWLQSRWPVFALADALWRRLQSASSKWKTAKPGAEVGMVCFERRPLHFDRCSLKIAGEAANSAIRVQSLFEEIGVSVARQGSTGLMLLGMLGSWKVLHELHRSITLVGPCPDQSVHYSTNADPSYTICLPVGTHKSAMNTILGTGRWKDCDPLHWIALSAPILSAMIGHVGVAVDVGFNIGFCTKYFLAMGLRVDALDLLPKFAAGLRGSARREEEAGRLSIHAAFVTNVEQEGATAQWRYGGLPSKDGLDLPALRLDKLLHDEPGPVVMKMDIDGWELEALQGAAGLLKTGRLAGLLMELHCDFLEERNIDCWDPLSFLISYGMKIMLIARWIDARDLEEDNFWVNSRESFMATKRQLARYDGSAHLQVIAVGPEIWQWYHTSVGLQAKSARPETPW